MNHCLVFGARGHLAQTRIIPALEKIPCPYTPISRKQVANLKHLDNTSNIVAYMAIPTHNFRENVTPYLNMVDPLYILEKPHGHSFEDFESIQSFVRKNNLKVLYADHYLGKSVLDRIETPDNLESIKVILHESADINNRINYFDSVGIVRDMYQSHCVLLFASVLTKYTNKSRREILRELRYIKPRITKILKTDAYKGLAPTQCRISFKYNDILLEADIAKMVDEKKGIYINHSDFYNLSSGPCPYEKLFEKIQVRDESFFLDEEEIKCLWDHFSIIEC